MNPTVLPRPVPDEMLTPDLIAQILDAAAALVAADGKSTGDLWPGAAHEDYLPGFPVCGAAAIGVAAGYTRAADVEYCVAAIDTDGETADPHPAFLALMGWLGVKHPEDVFDWSDRTPAHGIVTGLRACASSIRTAVVAA